MAIYCNIQLLDRFKDFLPVRNMLAITKIPKDSIKLHIHSSKSIQSLLCITTLYLITSSQMVLADTKTSKTKSFRSFHSVKSLKSVDLRLNEISDSRNKCEFAEYNLDKCSAQLIALNDKGMQYPSNMQELDSIFCKDFKKAVNCVKNSTVCFKPFERQIINWVLSSTRRMNYKRCKNENEKQKFLKLSNSCFQTMKYPTDLCMNNYIASLESISESNDRLVRLSDDDIQIQLSCCANRRFKECVMNNAKKMCKSVESFKKLKRTNSISSQRIAHKYIQKEKQDMMEDLKATIDGIALTGPELICQGVTDKFCETEFNHKYNDRAAKHMSIVPAMIKIYSNKQ